MTGASKSAGRLAGVNANNVLVVCMTICGFTAGLAGLVNMGRLGTAQPTSISSFLIDSIGVVVLGGTALTGGRGGKHPPVPRPRIHRTVDNRLCKLTKLGSPL